MTSDDNGGDEEEVEDETEIDLDHPFIYLSIKDDHPTVIKSKDISNVDAIEWLTCAIIVFCDELHGLEKAKEKVKKVKDMSMFG